MIRCVAESLQRIHGDDATRVIDSLVMALLCRLTYEQVCDAHPLFYHLQVSD